MAERGATIPVREEKVKRRRAHHSNSHSGCLTCKQRRIKCDEVLPVCGRCHSARRECRADARRLRKDRRRLDVPTSAVHTESLHLEAYAASCLQHFNLVAIPAFARSEPSPLWAYMKQEQQRNSSVRAVAIALGHEHLQASLSAGEDAWRGALFYSEAVRSLCEKIDEVQNDCGPDKTFTIVFQCLLLVILQCFRKSFGELNIHLQYGLKIASQVDVEDMKEMAMWFNESYRLLKQYSIAVALFNPLLPQDGQSTSFDTANEALSRPTQLKRGLMVSLPSIDDRSLEDEEQNLVLDIISTTVTHRKPELDGGQQGSLKFARSLEEAGPILKTIADLRNRHASLEIAIDSSLKSASQPATLLLKMAKARCMLLGIYLRCRWSSFSCHFDLEYDTFASIMDMIEGALAHRTIVDGSEVFAPGMSTIAPLFYVAVMCRQADTRRRAIKLLRETPQQEGPWDALLVETIARAIMEYEEHNAQSAGLGFSLTSYVPEHCRVAYYYYYHHYHYPFEQPGGERRDVLRVFRRASGTADVFTHEDIELQLWKRRKD